MESLLKTESQRLQTAKEGLAVTTLEVDRLHAQWDQRVKEQVGGSVRYACRRLVVFSSGSHWCFLPLISSLVKYHVAVLSVFPFIYMTCCTMYRYTDTVKVSIFSTVLF